MAHFLERLFEGPDGEQSVPQEHSRQHRGSVVLRPCALLLVALRFAAWWF